MKDPNTVTGIEAKLLDYCYPDYFGGSSAEEVLAVPVYRGMTRDDFHRSCKTEFNASCGFYDDVPDAGTFGEDALRAMVLTLEAGGFFEQPFSGAPEVDDDDGECYAYVGLFAETE